MATSVKSDFAPATRSEPAELKTQSRQVGEATFFRELLNAVPEVLMVLNANRQVVFANATFCQLLGEDTIKGLIGQRPGELLGCMHAHDNPGGCGTGPSCRKCGSVLSILSAQRGEADVRECSIALGDGGGALELKVAATPMPIGGRTYTVFSATDISGEKRRKVLEQLMFRHLSHDIEALHESLLTDPETADKHALSGATSQLLGVITTHRILAAAESGRLKTRPGALSAVEMLREVAQHCLPADSAMQVEVEISNRGSDQIFNADRTLVRHVLRAIVVNAAEASLPGETVTLSVEAQEERVTLGIHNHQPIETDTQLQLFQRGFTTKGEGRGLGLYGAKLITERYLGGEIGFASNEEEGTTFQVTLPLVSGGDQ